MIMRPYFKIVLVGAVVLIAISLGLANLSAALFGRNYVLPSGAIGVWNAADYISASKTIPNSAITATRDTNILKAPRRLFGVPANVFWGVHSSVTVTDANTTAPDGTNDATTVTAAGSTNWFLQGGRPITGNSVTSGQTYTVAISARSLSGGNLNFIIGHDAVLSGALTATTAWQRFTFTFTAASTTTVNWLFKTPDGVQAANFAICDWQVFLGSSDLNVNWATQAPQSLLNMDIVLDRSAGSIVSGGAIQHGSHGLIQMETGKAITPSAFTVMYVAKETGSPTQSNFDPILATLELGAITYNTFAIGPSINFGVGTKMSSANIDANPPGGGANTGPSPNIWGGASVNGSGAYVALHRFDGARATAFLNGVKLLDHTVSPTVPTFTDLGIGYLFNTLSGGNDIYYLAYWPRALSDYEVREAYGYAATKVALAAPRTALFVGTSISINVNTYAMVVGPSLNPAAFGASWGVSGRNVNQLGTDATTFALDSVMTGPVAQRYILSVEIGANDLGLSAPYTGNVAGFLTTLAAYHDARRAAGWKTVCHTIMARLDQADGGTQFILDRATANTTIRTWVPSHCDAVSDWAANATMGTDTAPNNTTFFGGDKVHPTAAGYLVLAPITAGAINSIPHHFDVLDAANDNSIDGDLRRALEAA